MSKSKKNVPFRKKVKDGLEGVGGLFAIGCGGSIITAFVADNPVENIGATIFFTGVIAASALGLASLIKPRKFIGSKTTVVGGSEW